MLSSFNGRVDVLAPFVYSMSSLVSFLFFYSKHCVTCYICRPSTPQIIRSFGSISIFSAFCVAFFYSLHLPIFFFTTLPSFSLLFRSFSLGAAVSRIGAEWLRTSSLHSATKRAAVCISSGRSGRAEPGRFGTVSVCLCVCLPPAAAPRMVTRPH